MTKVPKKIKYITFPIAIFRTFPKDSIKNVCYLAIQYAFYAKNAKGHSLESIATFYGFNSINPDVIKVGKDLFDKFGHSVPMVSVKLDLVMDFHHNPKTDFEIATFLAFCGLRSILGKKSYCKTNNELLMARMAGYGTYRQFVEVKAGVPYFIENFSTPQKIRYQLTEKIINNELCLRWGLIYYSKNTKGFYVSFKTGLVNLMVIAENNRKSNKLKEQKARRAKAYKEALDMISKQE